VTRLAILRRIAWDQESKNGNNSANMVTKEVFDALILSVISEILNRCLKCKLN
jgi:hypothetical protein